MTPAQEAKEFAAAHALSIETIGRRYTIVDMGGRQIAEVGGYPAALNAMKRWVCDNAFPEGWKVVDTSVEEGETCVPDAGAPTLEVAIKVKTRAEIIEDIRIGLGLSPGVIEHVAAQESNGRDDEPIVEPFPFQYPPKWVVWEADAEFELGQWFRIQGFASRAEAVKCCRQRANDSYLRSLPLKREIRYEV